MSARFSSRGRDPLLSPPPSLWQRERARGPILPMDAPAAGKIRARWRERLTRIFGCA